MTPGTTQQNLSSDHRGPPRHSYDGFSSTPNDRRKTTGIPRPSAGTPLVGFAHIDGSSFPAFPVFDTPLNMLPAADRTLEYPDDVIVDQNRTDPLANDGVYASRRDEGALPRGGELRCGGAVTSRGERPVGTRVLDLERLMDMPKLV